MTTHLTISVFQVKKLRPRWRNWGPESNIICKSVTFKKKIYGESKNLPPRQISVYLISKLTHGTANTVTIASEHAPPSGTSSFVPRRTVSRGSTVVRAFTDTVTIGHRPHLSRGKSWSLGFHSPSLSLYGSFGTGFTSSHLLVLPASVLSFFKITPELEMVSVGQMQPAWSWGLDHLVLEGGKK